jgi:hypothetical protein
MQSRDCLSLNRGPFVTGLSGKGVTHLVKCRFKNIHVFLYLVMSNVGVYEDLMQKVEVIWPINLYFFENKENFATFYYKMNVD